RDLRSGRGPDRRQAGDRYALRARAVGESVDPQPAARTPRQGANHARRKGGCHTRRKKRLWPCRAHQPATLKEQRMEPEKRYFLEGLFIIAFAVGLTFA